MCDNMGFMAWTIWAALIILIGRFVYDWIDELMTKNKLPYVKYKGGHKLLIEVLDKLNYKYNVIDNDDVLFTINDSTIAIRIDNDNKFMFLQNVFCYEAPLDDVENLHLIQRAVNEINRYYSFKVIYTYDNEKNLVQVHTYIDMLWIPQIPKIEDYFQALLNNLIESQKVFDDIMEQYRVEQ